MGDFQTIPRGGEHDLDIAQHTPRKRKFDDLADVAQNQHFSEQSDAEQQSDDELQSTTHAEDEQVTYRKPARAVRSKITLAKETRADAYVVGRIQRIVSGVRDDFIRANPRPVVQEAVLAHSSNDEYKRMLKELSTDLPSEEQLARVETEKDLGPYYLGRTASIKGGIRFDIQKRRTNGHTQEDIMLPAAETHPNQRVHSSMTSMQQGELRYMLGKHLMWHDIPADEFLSYSIDPLFLFVHAMIRRHENQSGVTIQFIDRRKATGVAHLRGEGSLPEPAEIYRALALYEIFDLPTWAGHRRSFAHGSLRARKFTQEYLSHGTVLLSDRCFRQAELQELIDDGLHDLFPWFKIPFDHRCDGLYTFQVVCRKLGFPPDLKITKAPYSYDHCATEIPFTVERLQQVQRMSRHWSQVSKGVAPDTVEPHLHAFLSCLTLQKRPSRDPIFCDWIKDHYSEADVLDLYWNDVENDFQPGFTHVASNLPGVMQYLDLVRDCTFALGLPDIPDNVVEETNPLTGENYVVEDKRLNKTDQLSRKYDQAEQLDQRDKKAKRRKGTKLTDRTDPAKEASSGMLPGDQQLSRETDDGDAQWVAEQIGWEHRNVETSDSASAKELPSTRVDEGGEEITDLNSGVPAEPAERIQGEETVQ